MYIIHYAFVSIYDYIILYIWYIRCYLYVEYMHIYRSRIANLNPTHFALQTGNLCRSFFVRLSFAPMPCNTPSWGTPFVSGILLAGFFVGVDFGSRLYVTFGDSSVATNFANWFDMFILFYVFCIFKRSLTSQTTLDLTFDIPSHWQEVYRVDISVNHRDVWS